jgi:hypothetical protein
MGIEWAKRQVEKKKIRDEALDNGFLTCAEPEKLQQICDALGPEDINEVFDKWLQRIPLPLWTQDRQAGYEWDLSIWQMEVSLTQIFERPLRGRESFEEIIRDNLDRMMLLRKHGPRSSSTRDLAASPAPAIESENSECYASARRDWNSWAARLQES